MLEMEQNFDTNEINEVPNTYEVPENSPQEPKEDNINIDDTVSAAVGKKWPGWPGESVFRFLIPTHKVGSIIGRKGEIIRKICEETRSRIKILDAPPGTAERAVMVSAKEEPDNSFPPAIDGLLRVHKRVLDGLEGDNGHDAPVMGGKVSTRLLAPAIQAGILIGKLGTTIKSIQEASNCNVRVLGTDALPVFALEDDRIVEVVGEPAAILKAIELIASHLRKFLVDRSIISVIEMNMQMTNPAIEHMPPPQSWGPPAQAFPQNATGGPGYGPKPHFLPLPRQMNDYYPQPDIAPPREKLPHQGITAYGREAPVTAHKSSSTQSMPAVITQITQKMQVPLTYADAVIGTAGSNISYIRRASGATVTIQETRGVPGEMTVEINGTASQVQTAQQLVQNFMAEAGAGSQTHKGGSIDQGYDSFATPGSAYTPPLNKEYTGQIGNYGASQSGGYNSTQSGGYGADQNGSYNVSQTGDYSDFHPEDYSSGPSGGYGSVYGGNYGYQTNPTY